MYSLLLFEWRVSNTNEESRSHLRRVESISGTVAKLTCIFRDSCGTVALMILGQLSDICGPTRSRFANIRKLTKDHKGYGSAVNLGTEHLADGMFYSELGFSRMNI